VFLDWNNLQALLNAFIIAAALIVVTVPQELPQAVSSYLQFMLSHMLNENILVKRMQSLETAAYLTEVIVELEELRKPLSRDLV
jgi:magnesium-transporting ATPase (P-type)